MIYRASIGTAAALFLGFAHPAFAQPESSAFKDTVFEGDYLIVGGGGAYGPSYEGSNDYIFYPIGAIQGRVKGIGISARPAGLSLNFIPEPKDAKFAFQLGPAGNIRSERHSQIEDPVVAALGKLDRAVELGVSAGFSINRIASAYDSVSFSVDTRWDVSGTYNGMVVAPSVTYQTPLSKAVFVNLFLTAEHVDNNYAHYFFDITPGGSAASGLPTYSAHGGWKSASGTLLFGYDLGRDLTKGGFLILAGGSYGRVFGNFGDSPIVSIRGSRDQFTGALGIGYIF
jgi:outer membrane scaffolding protein for murein synthesis (MipA/OmpV family)